MEIWYTSWSLWYVNNHAGSYIFKYEKESGLVNWQIASEAVYCFLNAWWYGPKRTWNYHESISIRFKSNSYHNWFIGKLWITAYPKLLLKNPRLFAGGKIPVVILALRHFLQHLQVLTYCGKMNHFFFFFYVETIWSALSRCFSDSLLLIMNSFIYAVGHYVAVKVKPERFFWFTIIIRLFCLVGKFVEHGTWWTNSVTFVFQIVEGSEILLELSYFIMMKKAWKI